MKLTVVLFLAVFCVALSDGFRFKFKDAFKIMQDAMDTVNNRVKRSFGNYGDAAEMAFRVADTNHDGYVSLDELIKFVQSTTHMNVDGNMRQGFVGAITMVDQNRDGKLNKAEFGSLVRKGMGMMG